MTDRNDNLMRLDQWIKDQGLANSRTRAKEFILSGYVFVNDKLIEKPSFEINPSDKVKINTVDSHYVSRAALKLIHGLDYFQFNVTGLTAMDLGTSTGGFCQVLLERGIRHIYGIEVGQNQLAASLINEKRLTLFEQLNAKHVTHDHVPEPIDFLCCDVSFIAIQKILPTIIPLLSPNAKMLLLVKPQFQLQPQDIGKNGIVRSADLHGKACQELSDFINQETNYHVIGITPSPVRGGDGNQEFLLAAI